MYYHAWLPLSLVCVWSALLLHNILCCVGVSSRWGKKSSSSPAQYHLAKYSSWDVYDHITPRNNNNVVNKHSSLFLIYIYHLQYFLHAAAFTWAFPFLFLFLSAGTDWLYLTGNWGIVDAFGLLSLTAVTDELIAMWPRPFAPRSPRKSEGQHLMWEGRELMAYLESVPKTNWKLTSGHLGHYSTPLDTVCHPPSPKQTDRGRRNTPQAVFSAMFT